MIYLKDGINMYRVKKEDILYIQQEDRNVKVVTYQRDFLVKGRKIDEIQEALGDIFFKCHSYLSINLYKIEVVKKHEVIMEDKRVVGMCYAATCRVKKELQKCFNIE